MTTDEFGISVTALKAEIDATVAGFFNRRDVVFDSLTLMKLGSQDIDQLAREAHFFGANTYPHLS